MSTILKALRRLEREKQPHPGKPLRDDVVALQPGEPQEGPDRTLWWASRVGTALILVLGSLWLASGIREDGQTEETRAPTAARPGAPVLASEAVVPVPPPARRVQEQPAPAAERPPARRSRAPQPTVPGKPTSPPKPAPAAVERPRPAAVPVQERADPATERPHRLPDPKPLHAFEAQTARAAAPVAAPKPEAFIARPTAQPTAPPAPQAQVESTTWHPVAGRRLALVSTPDREAVTLREGDAIGELVVLRIEPAAVVFLYDGREVSRRVGE